MPSPARRLLSGAVRYVGLLGGLAVGYVLLDFSIDIRPPAVHSSYHFTLSTLPLDEPRILRQDNLSILVIRRSESTRRSLEGTAADRLQDAQSSRSHQPDYAQNLLRSRHAEYFVAYATGTDLGCPVRAEAGELRESCGEARYDFAGRALEAPKSFSNLIVPDYTFANNFSSLTIYP